MAGIYCGDFWLDAKAKQKMTRGRQSSRYPYTYAADYVRDIAGYNDKGTKLSRADASRIISVIAAILGKEKKEASKRIADIYIWNQNTDET